MLMDGSPVSITRHEPLVCPRCGTAWHLKRGLCVNCLLSSALDSEIHDGQTLDDVLDQIDMSDFG
jgi:ribosomal protein S27AE